MKNRTTTSASLLLVLVAVLLTGSLTASATLIFPLPKAGTASQISKAVAASSKIKSIPANLDPAVSEVSVDLMSNTVYQSPGGGCMIVAAGCNYGDPSGKKLVVLFGDSHAWMWLAAINPLMVKDGYRLQLLWKIGCPVATLPSLPDATCTSWRASTMALINSEKPALVLLAERTTDIHATSTTFYKAAQWTAAMESTIATLKTPQTKVVVIGDIPAYANNASPPTCLSIHPTAVQDCSTPVHNTTAQWDNQSTSEKAAAKKESAGFIDPTPWICGTKSCSEIVGNFAVYFDWSHITATYSAYLAGNMGTKIKPFL